jgi:Protein of unknown function (DUF5674)
MRMQMSILCIETSIKIKELKERAKNQFKDRLIKAVVDVEKGVMAIGGAMHCDEESVLLEKGSSQCNLWGINIYPEKVGEEFIEYDSMINLRPSQENYSRGVDDPLIREKIVRIVWKLVDCS